MGAEAICDGCGKRALMLPSGDGIHWVKPHTWYERSDKDGIQTACSRECIKLIAEKTGKPATVLPL
jgi:hypothetical protein